MSNVCRLCYWVCCVFVRVLTWVRACVRLRTPGDAWMYFLRVCVNVCCMQPCEAVFPLAASRLLFPKQDAGFGSGLRIFVCTRLFNTECVHKCMLDSPQVLFHSCLCDISMRVSVHLHLVVKWRPVIPATVRVSLPLLASALEWGCISRGQNLRMPVPKHLLPYWRETQIHSSDGISLIYNYL